MKPLCIDLFCGLGGWTEGFLAEGYDCIGFDIERHDYGTGGYPGQLVLQDILTLDGSQFRNADCIVASPPCQEYSYMAMPWSRAKQIARALCREDDFPDPYTGSRTIEQLNKLFNACFRIQREASEAAAETYGCARCGIYHPATTLDGCPFVHRHIPMVVENVKGAQPWVGRATWSYGSFYLWGDVPALMPSAKALKWGGCNGKTFSERPPNVAMHQERAGRSVPGFNFHQHETNGKGGSFQSAAVEHQKQPIWFNDDKRRNHGNCIEGSDGGPLPVSGVERSLCFAHEHEGTQRDAVVLGGLGKKAERDGLVGYGGSFGWDGTLMRRMSSKSSARKAASAQIAKIPFALSRWIAQTYYPSEKLQETL